MKRHFYVGFDIGDAESIVEFSVTGTENVQPATMPGKSAAGQAIPTLYGYNKKGSVVLADVVATDYENLKSVEMNFKRRPSDLVNVSPERQGRLMLMDMLKIWNEPEFSSGKIKEYADKLTEFVNIILTEPTFVERAKPYASGCDKCVICVGHPTNWDAFDKFIYESILRRSALGQTHYLGLPLEFTLECESRAAFLYIKNTYQVRLADNEFVGLMDVGSSTIDISVLTKDSKNCVYDSGSNFLGARSIDYLILEHYINHTCTNEDDREMLNDILRNTPVAMEHLLLICRLAKEDIFSSTNVDKSQIFKKIFFGDFRPLKMTYDTLVNDICNRPIAPVLKRYCALPEQQCAELGNMGWKEAFKVFVLQEVKKMSTYASPEIKKMGLDGIVLNKLFLTGSASRMDFVHPICLDVMPQLGRGDSLFNDVNPSNAIAYGLARVGVSNYKASAFQADMNKFFDKNNGQLMEIVKRRISDLTQAVADPIIGVIKNQIVLVGIKKWKKGEYKTINEMMDTIEYQCNDEYYFGNLLKNDIAFNKAVATWSTDQVGNDIALALQGIAAKHKVYDFDINDLNIFTTNFKVDKSINMNKLDMLHYISGDFIAKIVVVVTAVVGYIVIPVIIGFVISIIGLIFQSFAITMLTTLITLPGGILILGIAGLAALLAGGVAKAYKTKKKEINEKLKSVDLPKLVRNSVTVEDIAEKFETDRVSIVEQTVMQMKKPEVINELCNQIFVVVKPQVEAGANQIKYVIENR